jgi:cell division protein FtsL
MTQDLIQAYKQAPWRNQRRYIAWILLFVVGFLVAAISNLNISAQTYAAGYEIQLLEAKKKQLIRHIADLRNQHAYLSSTDVMEEIGNKLGFIATRDPERAVYLVIPGYEESEFDIDAPPPDEITQQSLIKPIYTQSLWELFFQGALKLGKNPERIVR